MSSTYSENPVWQSHEVATPGDFTPVLVRYDNSGKTYRCTSCEYGCCITDADGNEPRAPYQWQCAEDQDSDLDTLP